MIIGNERKSFTGKFARLVVNMEPFSFSKKYLRSSSIRKIHFVQFDNKTNDFVFNSRLFSKSDFFKYDCSKPFNTPIIYSFELAVESFKPVDKSRIIAYC